MTTDKSNEKAPKVTLSLDDMEKESPKEPFTITVEKRTMTLTDPQDIDWLDLMEIEDDPSRFIILCLSEEDAKFFLEQRIESWKVNKLMDAFLQHYGLGARGKGRGSRR